MQWQEIRRSYPHQWLLVEATDAHTEDNQRIVEKMAVLGQFPDSLTAWQGYIKEHNTAPQRELYVVHTDRESLDIRERRELPMRGIWITT